MTQIKLTAQLRRHLVISMVFFVCFFLVHFDFGGDN